MNLVITPWSLFLLFGCFQAIMLALFFLLRRRNAVPGRILAGLMLVLALILFDHSLRLSSLYKSFPWGLYISDASWYLIAPLLWFYLKSRVAGFRFRWLDLLHIIPFLFFAFMYRFLPFASPELKVLILENYLSSGSNHTLIVKIFILLMMIQMLAYFIASWIFLKRLEDKYKKVNSDNAISEVLIMKRLVFAFGLYFTFEFSFSTFQNFNNIQNTFIENWSLVVWTFFLIIISYVAAIFPGHFFDMVKLEKRPFSNENLAELKRRLESFMVENAPYKERGLTLNDLAAFIEIKPHLLSYILNNIMHTSFYDFVNTYRVKEVANQLTSDSNSQYSIYGIAQNCGFNSKASFYAFFKKEFGCTPKAFLEKR